MTASAEAMAEPGERWVGEQGRKRETEAERSVIREGEGERRRRVIA